MYLDFNAKQEFKHFNEPTIQARLQWTGANTLSWGYATEGEGLLKYLNHVLVDDADKLYFVRGIKYHTGLNCPRLEVGEIKIQISYDQLTPGVYNRNFPYWFSETYALSIDPNEDLGWRSLMLYTPVTGFDIERDLFIMLTLQEIITHLNTYSAGHQMTFLPSTWLMSTWRACNEIDTGVVIQKLIQEVDSLVKSLTYWPTRKDYARLLDGVKMVKDQAEARLRYNGYKETK
jgi:hypothetical protein